MKREIIFLDEDNAIDYSNASKKDTSSIIAEVRKLKVNKEMKSFTKQNGISGVKYEIKLKNNDVITIAVPKADHYNQMLLNTIMSMKKVYQDEIVMTFNQNRVTLASRETGVFQGEKDTDSIMSLLRSMHNNKEISSVIKSGNKFYTYQIETKDNERLRIQVEKDDPFVKELDSFTNIYLRKNKIKKTLLTAAITTGAIATIATCPYTRGKIEKTYITVKTNVESYIEAQDLKQEMRSKWPYLESCAMRLNADNLSKDEYFDFMDELNSIMEYYEANYSEEELSKNNDYQKLVTWDDLVSSKYQDMMSRRVY